MKKKYLVFGWLEGSDYDAGKAANYCVEVTAESESQAEDLGDKKIIRKFQKCDVIVAQEK